MKVRVTGAVCVAILLLATAGIAQQGTTNQSGTMTSGTAVWGSIVSISNDVIVVRTDAGETMRFNRDASLNVPSNLVAGKRVSVDYNRLSATNMQLTRIELDDNADGSRTAGVDDRTGTSTGDRTNTSGTAGSNTYGNNVTGSNNTGNNTYGSSASGTNNTSNNTYGNNVTDNNNTGTNTYGNNATGNDNTGNTTDRYARLPQTASHLVLWAFAGLVSLGGALALRARRRR